MHACKCKRYYSKQFFVNNRLLYGCVRMHAYMHLAFKELIGFDNGSLVPQFELMYCDLVNDLLWQCALITAVAGFVNICPKR